MKTSVSSFVASKNGWLLMGACLLSTYGLILIQSRFHSAQRLNADSTPGERTVASAPRSHQLPFGMGNTASTALLQKIQHQTGIQAIRAREVDFYPDSIVGRTGGWVRMNLFPDVVVTAALQPASVLETNSNLYVGTIEGDPDGQFRFTIDSERTTGTITAFGKTYQIVPTGRGSRHYIVQTN